MARKTGGRSLGPAKNCPASATKSFTSKGNKNLFEPKVIFLCEDTESACHYFRYFIAKYNLNIDFEPKAKSLCKKETDDGLNHIFRKAEHFHELNGNRQIMIAFDLDEFYRNRNPKQKNRKAYEKFVVDNTSHDKFTYLSSFPCFEYWLYIHFLQSDKYFDSFDELLPELNKVLKCNKIKSLSGSICKEYSKSKDFWVKQLHKVSICLASNIPIDNLVKAIKYSMGHRFEVGANSHSDIWRFFEYFKEKCEPEISDLFSVERQKAKQQ